MKFKLKSTLKSKKNLSTKKNLLRIVNQLEVIDIDSIEPWEKNPKIYKNKIPLVINSIKQYGQRTPLSVWVKDNKIYKGNTTWYAMKEMGYKKIAVLWQYFKNQQEAAGYALMDNTTGANPDWEEGALAQLLQGEDFQGLDSKTLGTLTGFTEKDLKGYLLSTLELPDILPDVDISGSIPDKADFIVIQFQSREQMQEFKAHLGFETKHPRVVPYEDLLTVMGWTDASHSLKIKNKKIKFKKRR